MISKVFSFSKAAPCGKDQDILVDRTYFWLKHRLERALLWPQNVNLPLENTSLQVLDSLFLWIVVVSCFAQRGTSP